MQIWSQPMWTKAIANQWECLQVLGKQSTSRRNFWIVSSSVSVWPGLYNNVKGFSLPSCGKKVLTSSLSMASNIVSLILQNTGLGNHHNNREVNPLALFCRSSIIERGDSGWVKPTNVNDVWFILKCAFPVTVIQEKINHNITVTTNITVYYCSDVLLLNII